MVHTISGSIWEAHNHIEIDISSFLTALSELSERFSNLLTKKQQLNKKHSERIIIFDN